MFGHADFISQPAFLEIAKKYGILENEKKTHLNF